MSGGARRWTESSAGGGRGAAGAAGAAAPAAGARTAAVLSCGAAGAGDDASRRPDEHANAAASRQTDRREGVMRFLLDGGRVERREHERAKVGPGVVGDDAKRERELVA